MTFFRVIKSIFNKIWKLYDSAWGGGEAEFALRSITSRPYQISNLLKCHTKVLIIWHKLTKNQRHNFYDQDVILDFRHGERTLLSHVN